MQVGHCFFDGSKGSEHGSRTQGSFEGLQMILRPEGTMPLTYLKRGPIGPQRKKLEYFIHFSFFWQDTVQDKGVPIKGVQDKGGTR